MPKTRFGLRRSRCFAEAITEIKVLDRYASVDIIQEANYLLFGMPHIHV